MIELTTEERKTLATTRLNMRRRAYTVNGLKLTIIVEAAKGVPEDSVDRQFRDELIDCCQERFGPGKLAHAQGLHYCWVR